jgi:hypothetical protein
MTVTFSNPETARRFCRMVSPKGAMAGSAFWAPERFLSLASRWAAQMGDVATAQVLTTLKAKGTNFSGAKCNMCGAALSAPESVAIGLGPECQKDKAA